MNTIRFILFLFTILLCGCKNEYRTELSKVIGQELLFPDGMSLKLNGRDTLCPEFTEAHFKIINYIDTAGCMECKVHVFDWGKLQRGLDTTGLDIKVCFVVWSDNYAEIESLCRIHRFPYPLWYDYDGEFGRVNNIPKINNFRTCLVDENNMILAVGSPLYNEAIYDLYLKIASEFSK